MNKCRRLLTGLLTFCMVFQLCAVHSLAAEENRPYTYRITFYAGNQGVFSDTAGIEVVDTDNRLVTSEVSIYADASSVRVEGLKAGYTVSFVDIQGSAVTLRENSTYYVRGLRKGGYDNETVDRPAFVVEQDQDYVVAYGIRGDMVSYTIHYEDTAGNTLSPGRTYYGNAGDRPVVAFLYIEGYEPQAYNLTRTLSKNEAENIFTFVYSRTTGGGGGTAGAVEEGAAPGGGAAAETPAEGAGATDTAAAGAAGAGDAGAAGAGAGTVAAADDGTAADAGADVEAPDDNVPLDEGPQDLLDLDDEEVPLADGIGQMQEGTVNMLGAAAVGITASAALIALMVILLKRRRKAEEEKSE